MMFTIVMVFSSNLSLPVFAVSQVLGVSAFPLDNKCGAYTTYQLTFTPPTPLKKGDLIIVRLINVTGGNWKFQGGNASLTSILGTINCKLIIDTAYPPDESTVTLVVAEDIGAETQCLTKITGIRNPTLPGNYMVTILMKNATHIKAAQSLSPTFKITAPSFTGAIIASIVTRMLMLADTALSSIKPETVAGIMATMLKLVEVARSFLTSLP